MQCIIPSFFKEQKRENEGKLPSWGNLSICIFVFVLNLNIYKYYLIWSLLRISYTVQVCESSSSCSLPSFLCTPICSQGSRAGARKCLSFDCHRHCDHFRLLFRLSSIKDQTRSYFFIKCCHRVYLFNDYRFFFEAFDGAFTGSFIGAFTGATEPITFSSVLRKTARRAEWLPASDPFTEKLPMLVKLVHCHRARAAWLQ